MDQISKVNLEDQMYSDQNSITYSAQTESTEIYTPSGHDNTIVILHNLLHFIQRPHPIYALEIVKNGYKCTGTLEEVTKTSVATNKKEAKRKL